MLQRVYRGEKPSLVFAKHVLPIVNSNSVVDIIELGVGWCEFAVCCRDKGYRVSAADIDIAKIENARQLGFQAERIDLNNPLPYNDSSFDGCVMLEVIEHITMAEDLIREVSRILKKDAFLILSTPNPAYYLFRLRVLFGLPPREEGYHYRFFTKNKLSELLRHGGFNTNEFIGIGYFPFISGIMLKIKGYSFQFCIPAILMALFANRFLILARNRK